MHLTHFRYFCNHGRELGLNIRVCGVALPDKKGVVRIEPKDAWFAHYWKTYQGNSVS